MKCHTLAPGVLYYPHAGRVLWREDSAHPCMSWPLPLTGEERELLHGAALTMETEPELRSLIFRALGVDGAYAQMVYRDRRTKRDHVVAMLRRASRSAPSGGEVGRGR